MGTNRPADELVSRAGRSGAKVLEVGTGYNCTGTTSEPGETAKVCGGRADSPHEKGRNYDEKEVAGDRTAGTGDGTADSKYRTELVSAERTDS